MRGTNPSPKASEIAAFERQGEDVPADRGAPAPTHFLGVELENSPGVFSAREETELLGRETIRCLEVLRAVATNGILRMIDMGSGSGNLTCATAAAIPTLRVWASDIEESAAAATQRNAERHGFLGRVHVSHGDLFEPLDALGLEGVIDAVVSNPPYIATLRLEQDRAHLLAHEPRAAFDGGPYGISVQQRLVRDSVRFLRPGGFLLMEFGLGQARQVEALFARTGAYERVEFFTDAGGVSRVARGRRQSA